MSDLLRIGTRGSPLALAQAHEARDRLEAAFPRLKGAIEIVVIQTTGDQVLDRPLAVMGGKGLFTKEIDEAQLAGRVDIAVHSIKDLPTALPDGLTLASFLPREDVRDALLSPRAKSLAELAKGAVVGTSSLRRAAQVLRARPDVKIMSLRGNVQTRLRKLAEGQVDATLLAMAGLHRLGLSLAEAYPLSPEEMLPAVAQGAIGITRRDGDARMAEFLAALDHAETRCRVTAEREFLAVLDGSCRTPIAGLAELAGSELHFRGLILLPDGSAFHDIADRGPAISARELGRSAGQALLAKSGPGFLK